MPQSRIASPIRLGMVAWNALPAVMPELGMRIGGLETGAWTLARAVASHTSLIPLFCVKAAMEHVPNCVDDVAIQVNRERLRNVRRQVAQRLDLGWPPQLKELHWSLLWQVPLLVAARPWRPQMPEGIQVDPWLNRQNVDAWAAFGVNSVSAQVAATAKSQHRPLLLFLESNADLSPRILENSNHTNAYGESSRTQRYALESATRIICQSEFQMRHLKERFQREGVLIRNPIDCEEWLPRPSKSSKQVLWIGRFDSFHKRPHLAIEIAKRCPDLFFRMIINEGDPIVEAEIRKSAPENVSITDYVPFDRMPQEFARSSAFLCTGSAEHEGFPNVLLQAAATETPICSFEDFDQFISTTGCGVICGEDIEVGAKSLRRLLVTDSIDWSGVREYLETYHSMKSIAKKSEKIVLDLLENGFD